jgi:hypothetical protein
MNNRLLILVKLVDITMIKIIVMFFNFQLFLDDVKGMVGCIGKNFGLVK